MAFDEVCGMNKGRTCKVDIWWWNEIVKESI